MCIIQTSDDNSDAASEETIGEAKDMKEQKSTIRRVAVYFWGLITVSLGIVLCKKSGLGISPVSSIPFVLEEITELSFGTLTTLFHFLNTLIQMILNRKITLRLVLQFLLAFVFGTVIDILQNLIMMDDTLLLNQILALAGSIFFTALGMILMIDMDLIQNPPDGTVRMLSLKWKKELGTVKNMYDITCVVIASVLGLLFVGKVKGFGIATIASALLVGRTVRWMRSWIEKMYS